MSVRVAWAEAGEAYVVSLDAKAIVLRSSVPSPPGSRIEGVVDENPRAALRVKVHACKKQPDGSFELAGRPIDLPRELRERMAGRLA